MQNERTVINFGLHTYGVKKLEIENSHFSAFYFCLLCNLKTAWDTQMLSNMGWHAECKNHNSVM